MMLFHKFYKAFFENSCKMFYNSRLFFPFFKNFQLNNYKINFLVKMHIQIRLCPFQQGNVQYQ